MTCFVCNEGLFEPGTSRIPKEFRGRTYTVEVEGEACSNCDYFVMEGSDLPDVMRRLADEYRKEENLLTGLEIRSRRNKLNMTQEAFADHLKVGIASVKRWEGGLVQDRAMDELIRMKTDIQYALQNIKDIKMHWRSVPSSFVSHQIKSVS